jgi:hypothetical protein
MTKTPRGGLVTRTSRLRCTPFFRVLLIYYMNSDACPSKGCPKMYQSCDPVGDSALFQDLPHSTGSFRKGDLEPVLDDDSENFLLVPNNT